MNSTKKILIVEDDDVLLLILVDNLIREGFKIIQARNGQEGLEVALREHPDLILLDIIMPVMDGITMLKKLHEDIWGKQAKVIILTNLSDNEGVAEAMSRGLCDYLVKSSWKIEDVVKKVKEKLAKK
jgi:DNA-binding response OmpR family regulator